MNFKRMALGLFFVFISSAFASEAPVYQTKNGLDILPSISMSAGYNNNVLRTQVDPIASTALTLSPKIIGLIETQTGLYHLSYQVDAIHYENNQDDNIANQHFDASTFWAFNIQNRLQLKYKYEIIHEARGTGLTEGYSQSVTKPLRYHYQELYARYIYGSIGAKGRIVTLAGYESKKYNNTLFMRANKAEQSKYYDWEQPFVSGEFYYALSRDFHALSIVRFEDKRYQYIDPNPGYSKNSKNILLYGGLEWDVSGKTKGQILLGAQEKDFTDKRRENAQSFSWRSNITWTPRQYIQMKLEGGQFLEDAETQGDYLIENHLTLDWEQHWTPLISTITSIGYDKQDYPSNARKDKGSQTGVSLIYALTQWMDLSFNSTWEKRHSSTERFSYDQALFFFAMETAF